MRCVLVRWLNIALRALWISCGCLFLITEATNTRDICNRDPPDTTASRAPGDNGFRIKIAGRPNPEKYTPGQVYTVSINGTYPDQRLLGFMLVAVPLNARDESTAMGAFQHMSSGLTRAAENCPYVMTHSYQHPKAGVELLWTAPVVGTGCIEFRATVVEHHDIWYKDDGGLTRVFCEETAQTENHQSVEMIPDCCACGTGKYQMTFHGQWSSRSHPKDYPSIQRLLHWANIVGASHSKHYTIWQYGGYASQGVKEVCEFAYTRTLEEEMREHSGDMRTVIKTPGIWYSEPHGLLQSRWARFSVDRTNHLLSMLTMIGPSPDWCVGVSALNLCLPNCTWAGDMLIDLLPWDAGTDDGVTYMSPNSKSNPPQKITRITNTSPNNPNSPFFGTRPIRRLAQLEIRRIHPKEGETQQCVPGREYEVPIEVPDRRSEQEGECGVSEWGEWSECSVTCGVGQRFRRRMYLNPRVNKATCGLPLTENENCIGIENECEIVDEDCVLTGWSIWAPCSVTCGQGIRERRRVFIKHAERCQQETEIVVPCNAPIADCQMANAMKNFSAICSLEYDEGPCRGPFVRWYYDRNSGMCRQFDFGGCRGNDNRFQTEADCREMCSGRAELYPGDGTQEGNSVTAAPRRRKGKQPKATTTATAASVTVPTSTTTKSPRPVHCKVSSWSEWSTCEPSCGRSYKQRNRTVIKEAANGGKKCPKKLLKRKRCTVPKCVDCQMSQWGEWTQCARTCGTGSVQERTRSILSPARRNGEPCGAQLERRYCDLQECPDFDQVDKRSKREADLNPS